ncbi:hypothetical protein Q8A73_022210 [Channa argus]|nr:hypothetical protein Q8A73_022210 [Channa argus]
MPVVGVASKLRQPSTVGSKPVHTALPIPSTVRAASSQGFMARQQELRAGEGSPGLSCQLSIKSEYPREKTPERKTRAETEESKICKKCLAHFSGCKRGGGIGPSYEEEGVFKTPRQIVSAAP